MEGQGMDRRRAGSLTLSVVLVAAAGPYAALEGGDPAPRVVRLAGSHPALPGGAQDFRGNPATVAAGSEIAEAGAGTTKPLGLDGLSEQAAWASWNSGPRRGQAMGALLAWREFRADDLYRDDAGFLLLGWRRKNLGIGAGMDLLRADYGDGDVGVAAGVSGGLLLRFDDVVLGGQVLDLSALHARPGWMREPLEAALGVAIAPGDAFWRSAATAAWREQTGWSWRFAQEFALLAGGDVGFGVGIEPLRVACGAGWRLGWARLDVAAEGDPVLGWQTHVSLGVAFR